MSNSNGSNRSYPDGTENGAQPKHERSIHILMIPHPSLAHITPMVHLAQHLVSQGGGITCTIVSYDNFIDKVMKDGLPDSIHLLGLIKNRTGFSLDPGENDFNVVREEFRCTMRMYIEDLLQNQAAGKPEPKYGCLISDLTLVWSIETASKLGCSRYVFCVLSAFCVLNYASIRLHTDTGEEAKVKRDNSWLADSSMPKRKLCEKGTPFHNMPVRVISTFFESMLGSSGLLVNSFYDLESQVFDILRDMGWNAKPVGPLQSTVQVSKVSLENDKYVDDECLHWLDKQPPKSVVYVNFGTTGFNMFTVQMVHELALGLEASQARFLWVLRPPPGLKSDELDELLPSGFEERVKGRALVARGWAPQLKILEHPSTAAFLMHCGWNSMQEAFVRGIPFIGWATFADQPFNAIYSAEVVKTGLVLPHDYKILDRHDVEAPVRTMMFSEEGLVMRRNAEKMKRAAANAITRGGSSHENLIAFVDSIRSA